MTIAAAFAATVATAAVPAARAASRTTIAETSTGAA
jgi:hypothetical protein